MSDPVTNAEVEDVLSSIRRLVSEDRRPMARNKIEPPAEDKLVLTPSLRVSNEPPLVDAYKPRQDLAPIEWDDTAEDDTEEDDTREIDATEDDATEGDAALGGADQIVPTADSAASASDPNALEDDANRDFDDIATLDGAEEFDDFDLIANEDEFKFAPQGYVQQPEEEQPAKQPDRVEMPTLRPSIVRPSGMLNLGASELVEDVPSRPDRLSAKIAALETAISRIPENWEPDGPGEDDYSGSKAPAMAWEDDVELDANGAPLHEDDGAYVIDTAPATPPMPQAEPVHAQDDAVEDEEAQQDSGFGFAGDEYFDEEMLRDLVSEIVRSELQGALGERITRNVRKLVRREIHRALTAQELE